MEEILSKDERMWAMFVHIAAFAFFVIPFGNILGPLIIWMIKKEQYPFVEEQGKEALNFQISMTIYAVASIILIIIVIGLPVLIAVFFVDFVFTVIAAVKANDGEHYVYPLTIKFIK